MGSAMKQRGYSETRTSTRRYWNGLKLVKDPHKVKNDNSNSWEYANPTQSEHLNIVTQTTMHPFFGTTVIPSDMLPMLTGDHTEVHVQRIPLRLRQ
jgi:hypothetical protein